jgi:hypothetical protein
VVLFPKKDAVRMRMYERQFIVFRATMDKVRNRRNGFVFLLTIRRVRLSEDKGPTILISVHHLFYSFLSIFDDACSVMILVSRDGGKRRYGMALLPDADWCLRLCFSNHFNYRQ